MIAWLKSKLWPCKHGVTMMAPGLIMHRSLMVSSTNVGNVYRCSIWCRRCNSLVVRFEGSIEERAATRIFKDGATVLDDLDVMVWSTPEGPNWLADFDDPDPVEALQEEKRRIERSVRRSSTPKDRDLLG